MIKFTGSDRKLEYDSVIMDILYITEIILQIYRHYRSLKL